MLTPIAIPAKATAIEETLSKKSDTVPKAKAVPKSDGTSAIGANQRRRKEAKHNITIIANVAAKHF